MVERAKVVIHVTCMGKLMGRVMAVDLTKSIERHGWCVCKHISWEISGGIFGGGGCAGGSGLVISFESNFDYFIISIQENENMSHTYQFLHTISDSHKFPFSSAGSGGVSYI